MSDLSLSLKLTAVLNTLLEGMSIHVRDGVSLDQMNKLAAYAVPLLPGPSSN